MEREADKRKLHPFRQVLRLNKTSTGRISSRPTIMHRDMTSLDRGEKMEKFPAGPMIIGFILAPIWETSLQQVIIASEQDPYMVLTRPVAVVLMLMTFFIIGKSVLTEGRKK